MLHRTMARKNVMPKVLCRVVGPKYSIQCMRNSFSTKQSSRSFSLYRKFLLSIPLSHDFQVRKSDVFYDSLKREINAIKIVGNGLEIERIPSIRELVRNKSVAILSWNHGDDKSLDRDRKGEPSYLLDNSVGFQRAIDKLEQINRSAERRKIKYLIVDTINQDIFGAHKEYDMQMFENLYYDVPIITSFTSDEFIKRPWITREMRSLKRNSRSSLDYLAVENPHDPESRKRAIRKLGYTDMWFRIHKHLVKFHTIPFSQLDFQGKCPIRELFKQELKKDCIVTRCSADIHRPISMQIHDDELYRYSSSDLLKYDRPVMHLLREEEYKYHENYLHANMDVFTRWFDEAVMRLYFDHRPVNEEAKVQRRKYADSILTFLVLVANKQVAVKCSFDLFQYLLLLEGERKYLKVRRYPMELTRKQRDGITQNCTFFEFDLFLNYLRSDINKQLSLFGLFDHDSKLYMFGLCSEHLFRDQD